MRSNSAKRFNMTILITFLLWASLGMQQGPPVKSGGEAAANQQRARALIDQMINTLGGQSYLTLQDSHIEGRTGRFYHGTSEGGSLYQRFWQWPDKERLEYTKARDIVSLFLGENAYETTFRGTQVLDTQKDQDLHRYMLRRHYALEIVLRQWLNDPGTALFYEGPSLSENHSVERVTVMTSKGEAVTLLIDSISHLPVKKTFIIRDPQTKDRDEIDEVYDNWKKIDGINTPYNTLVTYNGELYRQYYVNTITFNSHLADSLFATPKLDFNPKKK
jgi:hypothetical protein